MKKCMMALIAVATLSTTACGQTVDLGKVDQKNPPSRGELSPPASDKDVEIVGLRATVTGTVEVDGKSKFYLLVNPASNKDTFDTWWVQEATVADGRIRGSCQFGEGAAGIGEYFAVIGIVTNTQLSTGEMLNGLPMGLAFSKLKFVRRK